MANSAARSSRYILEGRVTAVRLSWWSKNLDERKASLNELRFSRVGRRARLKGEVVTIPDLGRILPPASDSRADRRGIEENQKPSPPQNVAVARAERRATHPKMLPSEGQSGLTEKQTAKFRRDFPGLDLPWLEREFLEWVADQDQPNDYAAAFYGFMKRKRDEMA